MLERFNEEIKNEEINLALETHENWLEPTAIST
jgi:hypothetical protein